MKYVVLLGDGMSGYPLPQIENKTVLEAAKKPAIDFIAKNGILGLVRTIPSGMHPGSDIANMSVLGYDPGQYYTGRAPLEAASLGVKLAPADVAFRLNLVTLEVQNGKVYMKDYSAGHITTSESKKLIELLKEKLENEEFSFHSGVSYRHLMVWRNGNDAIETWAPHDITDKEINSYIPKGDGSKKLISLAASAEMLLHRHPVNEARSGNGKERANSIWLWGQGKAPDMPKITEKFGINGAVISAVDLVKGIGIYAGLKTPEVEGATGYLDTNYAGKVEKALEILEKDNFVYLHVEAPDEASHEGDADKKIKAVEDFDSKVVAPLLERLKKFGEYKVLVLPDHATPVSLKTHSSDPVPFAIFSSDSLKSQSGISYTEKNAASTGLFIEKGWDLLDYFLKLH